MDKALFYHIADVIQENRSWIEVIDTHDTTRWGVSPHRLPGDNATQLQKPILLAEAAHLESKRA